MPPAFSDAYQDYIQQSWKLISRAEKTGLEAPAPQHTGITPYPRIMTTQDSVKSKSNYDGK